MGEVVVVAEECSSLSLAEAGGEVLVSLVIVSMSSVMAGPVVPVAGGELVSETGLVGLRELLLEGAKQFSSLQLVWRWTLSHSSSSLHRSCSSPWITNHQIVLFSASSLVFFRILQLYQSIFWTAFGEQR